MTMAQEPKLKMPGGNNTDTSPREDVYLRSRTETYRAVLERLLGECGPEIKVADRLAAVKLIGQTLPLFAVQLEALAMPEPSLDLDF
jgi:hypothetical protein